MKVSVCITILNEEKNISKLIVSLLKQTKKPNEIVIVDGGSSDKSVEVIGHWQKKDKRIKCLVEKGSIAHGRNIAIDIAKSPIIAQIDAGCVAKRDWLEEITKPFKYENVGMVAGFYEMFARNSMQKAMNVFHGLLPSQFDPTNFVPSARSCAFRNKVWLEVGGYSEKFERAGEDTHFFYKIVKNKVKIARVKQAVVEWRETNKLGFKVSLKKFYYYAKGDAQAGIWWHPSKQLASHNIKIISIFLRYMVGIILLFLSIFKPLLFLLTLLLGIIYSFWAFRKIYLLTSDWKAGLWGIVIQFTSDFCVMAGFANGLVK
ncbi:hypothetical protein A2686_00500 [Candidatus Woesebacteria bacterium RIFCSPHIGHO2_01_FULL_38_10]|uniref:Glycosyltransferase 2-like domain-containing protein n=1 Tax=Candidatus Woesebacteria bacterium RIFCSPLOWO2_01_FULL_39_10b TaxID=1802517 RepID=A0A1F8B5V9_9BACT|nr:MAG: hypothetical protein A2686_00500 [Candidatus Woesebacteria bacterium RIFCSPHIGHO2_01_FULL_38_10]OGM59433.1 MAG: hypothetical protein A2892_02170 [Candidatus Woesebacteria bacterium RIFCSPLOWO2_01_FULL_39_10b]